MVKKAAAKKIVKTPKKEKVLKSNSKKTYVAIVLDKSSSMEAIRDVTINSFNEQLDSIKSSAGENTFVTLALFSDEVTISKFAEPVADISKITREDYVPNGMTAMYDAIGMTVERMKKEIDDINDPNTAVLFIVITDGQENSSKTWSALDISTLVKTLTKTKRWTFSILGANIDLVDLSEKIGVAKSNMAKYSATSKGVMRGTGITTQSLGRYFTTRNEVDDLSESVLATNFYAESSDEITDVTDGDKK